MKHSKFVLATFVLFLGLFIPDSMKFTVEMVLMGIILASFIYESDFFFGNSKESKEDTNNEEATEEDISNQW